MCGGRRIDYLVLHCTDTRPDRPFTVEALQRCHQQRGFGRYPGYHIYIRTDGTCYYTRPLWMRGCHVKGYNAHSIGVCYEGGRRPLPSPPEGGGLIVSTGADMVHSADMVLATDKVHGADMVHSADMVLATDKVHGADMVHSADMVLASDGHYYRFIPYKRSKVWGDTRTDAQIEVMDAVVQLLQECFPDAKVVGHNQLAAKACPCYQV